MENLTEEEKQYLNFLLDSIRQERDWYANALQEEATKHTETKEILKNARIRRNTYREQRDQLILVAENVTEGHGNKEEVVEMANNVLRQIKGGWR